MEGASFNEEEPDQQHSLPEPERRKPYNESAVHVGRKRLLIRLAIWTTAGLLIAIVIVAFSLAIIKNTYPEDTTRGSSPAVNEPDMPSEDEGGLDFDYGGGAGGEDFGSYDDFSYSSADDGGSYNVDDISTQDPTYFPTYEVRDHFASNTGRVVTNFNTVLSVVFSLSLSLELTSPLPPPLHISSANTRAHLG